MQKLALVLLVGCGQGIALEPVGETGARLSVAWSEQEDVVGVQVEARRVACTSTEPASDEVYTEQLYAQSPGSSPEVFLALQPGCWDLWAMPAVAFDGEAFDPSSRCAAARSALPVRVAEGVTTPVHFQSACVGDPDASTFDRGYNTPPEVQEMVTEGDECAPMQACALVSDTEDDPIAIDWVSRAPTAPLAPQPPLLLGAREGRREWALCAEVVPGELYELHLRDQALSSGELVPWPDSRSALEWAAPAQVRPPSCD